MNPNRENRVGPVAIVAGAVLLCGVLAAVASCGAFGLPGGSWVRSALTSRLFLVSAVVTAGSAAALVAMACLFWHVGRPYRGRPRGEDGSVVLEFAILVPIATSFVLIMAQSSLLMGGNLCVHYAAFCAARTAVVQVPRYVSDSEKWNEVEAPGASNKLLQVTQAAQWAVLPISCGLAAAGDADVSVLRAALTSFFGAYGKPVPAWVDKNLSHRARYAQDYTTVTLADPVRTDPVQGPLYQPHEDLKVSVRHVFYLGVPYAAKLFSTMSGGDGVSLPFGEGEYGLTIQATCVLPNEGAQDFVGVDPDVAKFAQ